MLYFHPGIPIDVAESIDLSSHDAMFLWHVPLVSSIFQGFPEVFLKVNRIDFTGKATNLLKTRINPCPDRSGRVYLFYLSAGLKWIAVNVSYFGMASLLSDLARQLRWRKPRAHGFRVHFIEITHFWIYRVVLTCIFRVSVVLGNYYVTIVF